MDSPDDPSHFRAQQLQTAIEHLGERSWRMAEVQCRILLAVDPTDIEAMLILGLAIAASGEASRAAPILDRVRRARPDHADPCRDFAMMEPRIPRALVTRQYRACLRLASKDTRVAPRLRQLPVGKHSVPDAAADGSAGRAPTQRPPAICAAWPWRKPANSRKPSDASTALSGWTRTPRHRLGESGHDAEDRGRFDEATRRRIRPRHRALPTPTLRTTTLRTYDDPQDRDDPPSPRRRSGSIARSRCCMPSRWEEGWRRLRMALRSRPGYIAAVSAAPLLPAIPSGPMHGWTAEPRPGLARGRLRRYAAIRPLSADAGQRLGATK